MLYVILALVAIVTIPLLLMPLRLKADPVGTGATIIAGHLKREFRVTCVPRAYLLHQARKSHVIAQFSPDGTYGRYGYTEMLQGDAAAIAAAYSAGQVSSEFDDVIADMEAMGFDRLSKTWKPIK